MGEGDQVVPVCNALVTTRKFHVLAKSQDWHPRDHISFFDNNEGAAVFSERSVPLPGPVAVAGSADVTTVKQVRNGAPSPLAHASPPPLSLAHSFPPPHHPITPSPPWQVMWPPHCVQGSAGANFHASLSADARVVTVLKGTHRGIDSYSAFGDAFQSRFENTGLNKLLRDKGVTYVVVVGLALDFCVNYTCLDARRLGFVTYLVLSGCRAVYPANADKVVKDLEAVGVIVVKDVKDLPEEVFPPGSSLA